jgi:putative DeoR family transcriptional regulator (stage III sporulation protein D)
VNKQYLESRVIDEAQYIVDTLSTIRKTAKIFGVSKSTIHKDITKILPDVSSSLYKDVKLVMEFNWNEKNIRGGLSTQKKYKKTN